MNICSTTFECRSVDDVYAHNVEALFEELKLNEPLRRLLRLYTADPGLYEYGRRAELARRLGCSLSYASRLKRQLGEQLNENQIRQILF